MKVEPAPEPGKGRPSLPGKAVQPVQFPGWRMALAREGLDPKAAARHREAIGSYLEYCRNSKTEATISTARRFMERAEAGGELSSEAAAGWKAALNWYFQAGRRHHGAGRQDLGETDWERRLIERVRTLHLQWRTEETYRGWIRRWSRFLAPRRVEEAGGAEAGEFLTWLATNQRLSVATQRQALNALVFFLREVSGQASVELGQFASARRSRRLPTVLTRAECQRLFETLTGTTQLMAELMYGSGLRLMELLRLRVKDVDLERCLVTVRAGKGDKDRATVLPESLVARLRAHRDRVRGLFEQDRAQGVAGVWMPEALAERSQRSSRILTTDDADDADAVELPWLHSVSPRHDWQDAMVPACSATPLIRVWSVPIRGLTVLGRKRLCHRSPPLRPLRSWCLTLLFRPD